MVVGDTGVQDAEVADHAADFVREERVGDPVFGREVAQDILGVIADGEDLYAVAVEGLQVPLQLDELRLAGRSPGGASVKENQRPVAAAGLREPDMAPRLVGQYEVRHRLSEGRARWEVFPGWVSRVDQLRHLRTPHITAEIAEGAEKSDR